MAECLGESLSEESVSTVLEFTHQVKPNLKIVDAQVIEQVKEKILTIPGLENETFREGIDMFIGFSGMGGGVIADFVNGCSMFFFQMPPEAYQSIINLIGKSI
jgi:hypothetical protein